MTMPEPLTPVIVTWFDSTSREQWDTQESHLRWWGNHHNEITTVGIFVAYRHHTYIIARDRTVIDDEPYLSGVTFIPEHSVLHLAPR